MEASFKSRESSVRIANAFQRMKKKKKKKQKSKKKGRVSHCSWPMVMPFHAKKIGMALTKKMKLQRRRKRSMELPNLIIPHMGDPVFGAHDYLPLPSQPYKRSAMVRNAMLLQAQEKRTSDSLTLAMAVGEKLLGNNWTKASWSHLQQILATRKEKHIRGKHGLALSRAIAALSSSHCRIRNTSMAVTHLWDKKEKHAKRSDTFIEILLNRLSVLQLFQLRLVCKSWNSFLRSPSLLHSNICSQTSYNGFKDTWIIVGRVGWRKDCLLAYEFPVYSFLHGQWFHLPLDSSSNPGINAHLGQSYCLVKSSNMAPRLGNRFPASAQCIAVDAAGGLLCFLLDDQPICEHFVRFRYAYDIDDEEAAEVFEHEVPIEHLSVFVCNPITGASRNLRLPSSQQLDDIPDCIAMSVCKGGEAGYCIILYAGYGTLLHYNGPKDLLLYCSKTETWSIITRPSIISEGITVMSLLHMGHFITSTDSGVKALNVDFGVWMKIDLPYPTHEAFDEGFMSEWRISLYAVDYCPLPYYDKRKIYAIYRLDPCMTENIRWTWKIITRTPRMFDSGMLIHNVIAKYNLVFVSFHRVVTKTYMFSFVYNLETDQWHEVPPYKRSHSYEGIAVFRPQLHANV